MTGERFVQFQSVLSDERQPPDAYTKTCFVDEG